MRFAVSAGEAGRAADAWKRGTGSAGPARGGCGNAARDRWADFSGRTFVRGTAGVDAGGERAGAGGGTAAARVSAASARQAGTAPDRALPYPADAGPVCERGAGRVWNARGAGGGADVDSGADGAG